MMLTLTMLSSDNFETTQQLRMKPDEDDVDDNDDDDDDDA